jgi:phospholipid/cholesterol/gamma-HCH transport system ATP-binding protein
MIRIENIYKSFGDREVLKAISATFSTGKTNLIIGASGSGKTVTMKTIVGLIAADRGEIFYDDVNFSRLDNEGRKEIRKQVGMLFQGGALFDSFSVERNVMFPLDMFTNLTLKEKLARVNSCLDRVNLPNVNKLLPSEISGGMKKRVGIARAIVLNPKYLFCDEPNSGLDPITSLVIDKLIKEITLEYNITTIINTHDMNSVMENGDYILFLYNGEKRWEGSNKDIIHSKVPELNDFIFASEFLKEAKEAKQAKEQTPL